MAADPLFINASAGAPAYSANELRQAMALALMYDGRNMGARKGVRPGGNQLQVSYAAPTITVQPGLCYLDPALSTPQGGYWVAIPAAETFTLAAADATNPRKDIVVCRVYDHDEDASGLRLARPEYLVGTPNPSPSEPAVPAGAIKLALLDVPASPGAVVVTDRRPWTVAAGGILPVAAAGDIAAGVAGRYRHRLDTGQLEQDTGSAWRRADWFSAWGRVGGNRYNGGATTPRAFNPAAETYTNMEVAVSVVAGRSYRLHAIHRVRAGTAGDHIFRFRDNNVSGQSRGYRNVPIPNTVGIYEVELTGYYDAAATGTATFVTTSQGPGPGSVDLFQGDGQATAVVEVYDVGPTALTVIL